MREVEVSASHIGYRHMGEGFFVKNLSQEAQWFFNVYLWGKLPYSVFSTIGCNYVKASKKYSEFLMGSNINLNDEMSCSFSAEVDRYAEGGTSIKISNENEAIDAADCFVERVETSEKTFLAPRVDQGVVVSEYFKPIVKWPSGDLKKCCSIIIGYGLVNNDWSLIDKGVARVFEILNRPGYNQGDRAFFESIKNSIDNASRKNEY